MHATLFALAITVKSAAFTPDSAIPKDYTCDGKDQSPEVELADPPPNATSWALIADDPDAGNFVHWVAWNLSPKFRTLDTNVPQNAFTLPGGGNQGRNSLKKIGYSGPCPPPGKPHHYRFRAFALDVKLNLPSSATASDLEQAMRGHILAEGTLIGTYAR